MKIYSTKSAKSRICANKGSIQDMIDAVEGRIDELESGANSSRKMLPGDTIAIEAVDDIQGTYFDDLKVAVQDDIRNEVNDLDIQVDNVGKSVVVVINYLGSIIEFNVPFADLSMGSDIEGDSAYIGNSIRQELDSLSEEGVF